MEAASTKKDFLEKAFFANPVLHHIRVTNIIKICCHVLSFTD